MLGYNLSGTWRTVKYAYVKVGGAWRWVGQIYVRVDGVWRPIWSYAWTVGEWSGCSKDCGGGTQTRTVACGRNDGFEFDDAFCEAFAGTKPATSQACNTQSCSECYGPDTDPPGHIETETGYYVDSPPEDCSSECGTTCSRALVYIGTEMMSGSCSETFEMDGYVYTRDSTPYSTSITSSSAGSESRNYFCLCNYSFCRTPA